MGEIYSAAATVLAFLGPSSETSALAIKTLNVFGNKLHVNYNTFETCAHDEQDKDLLTQSYEDTFDDDVRCAMRDLLGRPWFERMWIVQEFVLAKTALMICGYDEIARDTFCTAAWCLDLLIQASPAMVKDVFYMRRLRMISRLIDALNRPHRDIEDLLYQMKDCCCSDARDRVYANLSLTKQDCRFSVQPDYTTPTNEVYRNVFTQYIKLHDSMNMMTSCQMRQPPFNFVLPTWVPDWSIPVSQRAWHAMASGCSAPEYQISEDTLTTTGVFIDSIVRCSRVSQKDTEGTVDVKSIVVDLGHEYSDLHQQSYPLGGSLLGAYSAAMIQNKIKEKYPSMDIYHYPPPNVARLAFQAMYFYREPQAQYVGYLQQIPVGYGTFLTTQGYLGTAPSNFLPGDRVYVFPGCESPMILRSCATLSSAYYVVGFCYLHGFMDAEGLLGQLPPGWRVLWDGMGSSERYCYINDSKCLLQTQDPRLGELPRQWRVVEDSNEQFPVYENQDIHQRTCNDPRLSTPMLKARGTNIESIQLL